MALPPVSRLLQQFVDDELLRAPMVYDQLVEATADAIRRALPSAHAVQRSALADLTQVMLAQRTRMADYFMRSLGEQVQAELVRTPPGGAGPSAKAAAQPKALSLVDEDEVAINVELSHTIEAVKSEAEYELRELQTFVAALVGDLEMSADHNPFRAEAWARAVWDSAQALPLSRSHQVAFMRHASKPLAQLLRTSYAASSSRLEGMGVEPAAYRTMILPSGSRRGSRGGVETTFTPDLYRMSETMPGPLAHGERSGVGYQGQQRIAPAAPAAAPASPGTREHWSEIASGTTQRADRQAIELVSRLFEAMLADSRVPPDVTVLISRLHGPAMRLALRDRTLLDHSRHPLWRFVNLLVFAAQMSPDAGDPERMQLLRLTQATIDQLSSEPVQNSAVYRWALERLEQFLAKRTQRRLAGVATQVGALQKLEAKHANDQGPPSTMSGPLDHHQLDTVPAEFMDTAAPADDASDAAGEWLTRLKAGDWVRMFFQGRWVQAQLLWPGERREFFLFGDGASDATWAVRRNALVMMFGNGLAKTLKLRSIVGSAAAKVDEQLRAPSAA